MDYARQIEDVLAQTFQPARKYVPAIARFLLVVTFLEDSLRLILQWKTQVNYFERHGFGVYGAVVFLLFNLIAQVSGSSLVILNLQTSIGAAILLFDVFLQATAYGRYANLMFILRDMSVCGGLLLLVAEGIATKNKSKSFFPGLPVLDQETRTQYLQLAGRVLLVCLCFSLLVASGGDFSPIRVILIIVGCVMCGMVILGYRAKITAVILLVVVSIVNVIMNSFWQFDAAKRVDRDFIQYDFFQTLSVLGGFLLLIFLGPGELSMDERKKKL